MVCFHFSENREKFILYVAVSILVGTVMVLLLIIVRLRYGRHKQKTHRGRLDISTPGAPIENRPSVWEAGLSPSEPEAGPPKYSPTTPTHPPLPSNPEERRLLSTEPDGAVDTTIDTEDGGPVVFTPHGHRTLPREPLYRNNHYSTNPKTFASPTNGNGQYHAYTLSAGQRPNNNLYNNQFRTSPNRTNSFSHYDSEGSTFDNYFR